MIRYIRDIGVAGIAALVCLSLAGCSGASRPAAPIAGRAKAELPRATLDAMAAARKADASPKFDYPWTELDKRIETLPGQRLLLVGYGSLLNLKSAARTIHGLDEKELYPVVAVGAKRLFDYRIPADDVLKTHGPHGPTEIAALNVIATGDAADVINGRIMPVAVGDLPGMREREYGYNLQPVTCVRWDALDSRPFTAYVLCAEDAVVKGRPVIEKNIQPNPGYVDICVAGAKSVSVPFYELFVDTTYLADGTTPFRQWLESHPDR